MSGANMKTKFFTLFIIIIFFAELSFNDIGLVKFNNSIEEFQNQKNKNIISTVENTKELLHRVPRALTENKGQLENDEVRFYDQGGSVWFTDSGVWFELKEELSNKYRDQKNSFDPMTKYKTQEPTEYKKNVIKLEFLGVNQVRPVGRERLGWNSNFFYGNDSSKWCTDVPNYGEVFYENLYDGIDLRYYTNEKGLKYDFIIHPSADYTRIKVKLEGHNDLMMDENGALVVHFQKSGYTLQDTNLKVFYEDDPEDSIPTSFCLLNKNTYTFLLKSRDMSRTVIIDPLVYSTFIGGSNIDYCHNIAVDGSGNTYITGWTESSNFPTTLAANDTVYNGYGDGFVVKLNPISSTLVYSTFIGGSGWDEGNDIAVDGSGYTYISGWTQSSDFPTTPGANDTTYNGGWGDSFAMKLNPIGSTLVYSTFIGGSDTDGCCGIALDNSGAVYISGLTESSDFPTTLGANDTIYNGGRDRFVVKLNSTGSTLVYSTFIGGSNDDEGIGIVLDSYRCAYITGSTWSSDFPTTSAANDTTFNGGVWDGFVVKLNATGSTLVYSTFIGGSGNDFGNAIAVDDSGDAFITGGTGSLDFPTTPDANDTTYNGNGDGFIMKLNSLGSTILYSTFIGGSNDEDSGYGIAVDYSGYVYITGETWSSDFPTTPGAYNITYNENLDGFAVKLNPTGSTLLYSTFIGGINEDRCSSITLDNSMYAYITGTTQSSDFPTTLGAYSTNYNGGLDDGFMLKLLTSINNPPIALDLKISESFVYRNNSIYLYSNGTDLEDFEKNLTPFFEYRDPNELFWNCIYFSAPYYQNSKWCVSFTPPKNATLGLYDFRVRFNDTGILNLDKLFSSWLFLNDSLLVLNNIPLIEDLTLSNNSALLGDLISIWINATDLEEIEINLTIELEYRDPNKQSWNTTYLNIAQYLNDRWDHSLSIPFNAPFGYYDFRVRCNDSDGNYSSWYYLNDSLLVYNLNPDVINLKLSVNSIYRTHSLSLFINGTDHETPEKMLSLYSQVKPKNGSNWINLSGKYLQNFWKVKISTEKNSILGFWDFRVRFEDNESESSDWFYLNDSLEVLNNLPEISDELDDISVSSQPFILDLSQFEFDIEDSNENLKWEIPKQEYSYLESISLIDSNNDTLKIVPLENITGTEDIELMLFDKDYGFTSKSNITVIIDSKISELPPEVALISPVDNSIVDTLKPTLIWKLNYTGTELINYKIILDDNPEPVEELKNKLIKTEYILETELEDGKTYYWTVVPYFENEEGICISGVWSFSIKLKEIPNFNLELSLSTNFIKLKPGGNKTIKASVKNLATIKDEIELKLDYISNKGIDINIVEPKITELNPNENHVFSIVISISEDVNVKEILISLIAKSNNAPMYDQSVEKSEILTVKILEISEKGSDSLNSMLIIVIIIVILIVVFLIIFVLMKKKKKEPEEKIEEPVEPLLQHKLEPTRVAISDTPIPEFKLQPQQVTHKIQEQVQTQEQIPVQQKEEPVTKHQQIQNIPPVQYIESVPTQVVTQPQPQFIETPENLQQKDTFLSQLETLPQETIQPNVRQENTTTPETTDSKSETQENVQDNSPP